MERDFLGIGGKVETTGNCCNDSAFVASSILQRPPPKNMSDLHQFMSAKTAAHEDRIVKNVYDQYPSCGFHPLQPMGSVDATHKSSPMLVSQKNFSTQGQDAGAHLFTTPVYPSMQYNSYGNPTVHHSHLNATVETRIFPSIPMSTQANPKNQQPFEGRSRFAAPVNQYTDTAFPRRYSTTTVPVPATAQLTIFYGGAVNVYDNVPIEKAREIMSLATNSSSGGDRRNQFAAAAPPPLVSKNKVVEVDFTKVNRIQQSTGSMTSPCSTFSSPTSAASRSAAHSGSGSSSHDSRNATLPAAKRETEQPPKTRPPATSPAVEDGTLMVRDGAVMDNVSVIAAVPMARKASLARFLEKRKERMTNAAPYSAQKAVESGSPGNPTSAGAERKSLPESRENSRPVGSPPVHHHQASQYQF